MTSTHPAHRDNQRRKAARIADSLIAGVLNGRATAEQLELLAGSVSLLTDDQWALAARAANPDWKSVGEDTRHRVIRKLLSRAQDARLAAARSTLRQVGAELRRAS